MSVDSGWTLGRLSTGLEIAREKGQGPKYRRTIEDGETVSDCYEYFAWWEGHLEWGRVGS